MKKIALIAAAAALLGSQVASADINQLISEAKATNKKAASVGFQWRDAGKMIAKAEAAAKKGDMESAKKLASKAKSQGELGYQQYLDQRNAGPR